jgi:putative spermidine/putrescine transport system substrate-binding protein
MWAIVKGGKNVELAQEFVRFATGTQPLADQSKYIAYAPARTSSVAKIPASNPNKAWLPNAGHAGRSMLTDAKFWTDNGDDLNKRFSAWMAK